MAKRLTHAKRLRALMAETQQHIMALLGWDEVTYCWFKYYCGCAYLDTNMGFDTLIISIMERDAKYWGWWKLHWYHRESDFLQAVAMWECGMTPYINYGGKQYKLEKNSTSQFREAFKLINDPAELALAETEDGKTLEDSYCRDLVPSLGRR